MNILYDGKNEMHIEYEIIPQGIYIHNIIIPEERRNAECEIEMLNKFLLKNLEYDVFLYISRDETNSRKEAELKKFGFSRIPSKIKNPEIPYNYTHHLQRNQKKIYKGGRLWY